MARVVAESRSLNKKKLYGSFFLDLLLYGAEVIGLLAGLAIALIFTILLGAANGKLFVLCALVGLGIGILVKTLVTYPDFNHAPESDVLTLMSDPYASPLRGQPVKLQGELIGRGDAGYAFGSDLKLQDRSGMIYLHYASRFGPIGNFLFGMKQVKGLIGLPVDTVGWFRRGIMPWVDLVQLKSESGTTVKSYHRFWSFLLGGGAIALGFAVIAL
jgi:hypothetical protein